MRSILKSVTTGLGLLLATSFLGACDRNVSSDPITDSGPRRSVVQRVAVDNVPTLGAAASFAVFGGSAGITNQGTKTLITGDIGTTAASTAITGFHSPTFVYVETPLNVGTVNGLVYTDAPEGTPADFALAKSAVADAQTAFNSLAALPGGTDPGAGKLGGLTLAPGVYKSASGTFEITGSDLTLDGQGDLNSVWVFQMSSSLTVGGPAAPRQVILTNGAQAKNIYWQVGSSATINGAGGGSMAGTIIASSGVMISTPGNLAVTVINGRALALFASVTMVNTWISNGDVMLVPPDSGNGTTGLVKRL